jgi:hypothetical protein
MDSRFRGNDDGYMDSRFRGNDDGYMDSRFRGNDDGHVDSRFRGNDGAVDSKKGDERTVAHPPLQIFLFS